jgi:hypothetical protein
MVRAYGEVLTPIGLFRVGRQAFTEGTGTAVTDDLRFFADDLHNTLWALRYLAPRHALGERNWNSCPEAHSHRQERLVVPHAEVGEIFVQLARLEATEADHVPESSL